jgi:hypothetical protein
MQDIRVKDLIGIDFENEDAIVLRNVIKQNISEDVTLDFTDIPKVPSTFLCCLFTDLINARGREYVAEHISVKNLSNIADYRRVVLGTAFQQ